MKTKSKALLLSLCAVLLVAASVLGTMAYLTSHDEVKNTFTVGKVAITLDEAKVDEDGNVTGEDRVEANDYKLLPGHTYTKDPIVHVASTSEDCYLFVEVVNGIADIEDATTTAEQMKANGWIAVDGVNNLYVYGDPSAVSAGANITVFKTLKIDGDVNNDTLAEYDGETITVTAYAVQKDGFEESTASEIWAATFGAPVED